MAGDERETLEASFFLGLQHVISMLGSLVLLPLVIVPAAGGTDKDMQKLVNTLILVSGITTLVSTMVGHRLPLLQGANLAYLAAVLAAVTQPRYKDPKFLKQPATDRFAHIMRDLQGAVIISALIQTLLGISGVITLFIRWITPVMVATVVTAVGLSFIDIGFTNVATCVEIGLPALAVLLLIALVSQPKLFQAYAVPFTLLSIWILAVILTMSGAWNYKGCDLAAWRTFTAKGRQLWDSKGDGIGGDHSTSSAISGGKGKGPKAPPEWCTPHLETMAACRTDAKTILRDTVWLRIPVPLQWGTPIFHIETITFMLLATLVSTVDAVGVYHVSSMLVYSKPPPTHAVSRAVFVEGLGSLVAGLLGTGMGCGTLTDNIHTLALTRHNSRRALQVCSVFLIVLSVVAKVGALVASIPPPIAYAILCFLFALNIAVGVSFMRFTDMASGRNLLIFAFTLYMSLSIPSYFEQYQAGTAIDRKKMVYQPDKSRGPIQTHSHVANFILNSLFSMQMFIAFTFSLLLELLVPGTAAERGLFVWNRNGSPRPSPPPLSTVNTWFKWTAYQ